MDEDGSNPNRGRGRRRAAGQGGVSDLFAGRDTGGEGRVNVNIVAVELPLTPGKWVGCGVDGTRDR
jgi:hypothetical protein